MWYSVKVRKEQDKVPEYFEKLFLDLLGPRGMALFVEDNFSIIGEEIYYFSPECENHIKYYLDAIKCIPSEKPLKGSVIRLVGYADEFMELFN